jgi:catechol 2,3-dioxygenase-like lactoylglutathione lyase family enzyme
VLVITGIDHIVLVCPQIDTATAVYSSLLGRSPDWRSSDNGAATSLFTVQNTALELMAPDADGPVADRLREIISDRGPGLTSIAFRTDDIEAAHHSLGRRGLIPGDITDGASTNVSDAARRRWKRFRCSDEQTAGIKTFILQPDNSLPAQPAPSGSVHTLDHVVINTPNPDRALGLYGARLGLDLRLDRTAEQWKTRFLFFRTGGLTLEVINRLGETQDPASQDSIWGLTWTVENLQAAHERLSAAGFDISEIRTGRKPGSTVFTVRDGTMGVPTLFISHAPR